MRLPSLSLAVFDTETTGIMPRVSHVIEFASIRAEGGKIVETWEKLYGTEEAIPDVVQVLTRIRPADTAGKAHFKDSLKEIDEKLSGVDILVGQNLAFDLAMLKGEGLDLTDRPWVDTSLLASLVFPEFRSYSLQYMSTELKLNHEPAHRALGDVVATTELLGKIWERLLELPTEKIAEAKEIMSRANEGYRLFFSALPEKGGKGGDWSVASRRTNVSKASAAITLEKPPVGVIEIREEGLHPDGLQMIVNGAAKDTSTTHWIAVKNLEANLRRIHLPKGVTVIHPPYLLLNPEAAEKLAEQKELTAEEGTLLLKLNWFKPRTRADVAVHGNEKDVWSGKLTCTAASPVYTSQFNEEASVFLLDHRQLLHFVDAADNPIKPGSHVIVDDASMLEDTATKAWGEFVSGDALRAASVGDDELMRFTDMLALWTEKVRGSEDSHFLTGPDMERIETKGLKSSLEKLLTRSDLSEKTTEMLKSVEALLDPEILQGSLAWCERRYDGAVTLQSAPRSVDGVLHDKLYGTYSVTLISPRGSEAGLPEIVPQQATTRYATSPESPACPITVTFPEKTSFSQIMADPPHGKTICLLGSKRAIEGVFVKYTEVLEEKNMTLICQGMSGGQNRMESEFIAAQSPAMLVVTPFMYEGLDLPRGTADMLIIDNVPFDHPNQVTIGHRKNHYKNGFTEYCLPRAEFRLFRLLRTFCRHRSDGGEVIVTDPRLNERDYGRRLKQYLGQFALNAQPAPTDDVKPKPAAKKKTGKKPSEGQQQLPL